MKIVKPFFYGILASFGALLIEMIIKNFSGNDSSLVDIPTRLSWFLVLAVSIEELLKILLIHKYYQEIIDRHDRSRSPIMIQGEMFYGALLVGLGFSFLEIFFFTYDPAIRIQVAYLSILSVVFLHILTAGLIGYFLSRENIIDYFVFLKIFIAAASLHLLYNVLVIYDTDKIYIICYLVFILIFLLLQRYRQQRKA